MSHRSSHQVKTRWMKFGNIEDLIILHEQDVIAIASGIYVMFYNLTTREERIEKFDSTERGKGASCLAGHPVVPMFATAERQRNPKISIFTYPGIRKVSNCIIKNGPSTYLSCIFAGTEYLLTLTGFPHFRIIVWLWKTGENITSIDTNINDHHQRIACCPSLPYQVSQIGKFTGNLTIYEMNVCSRIVTISRTNEISSINKIVCASWTLDGNLLDCDAMGNVTLNTNDGKIRHLIVRGDDVDIESGLNSKSNPLIESFKSGVIIVNRESRIMFYRKPTSSDDNNRIKSASPWKLVWSINQTICHPVGIIATSPSRDTLLFYNDRGEIFESSPDNNEDEEDNDKKLRLITHKGSKYKFITPINPRREEICAIDKYDCLSIFQSLTGQLVTSVSLKIYGSVRCIASQPNFPIVAIGTACGKFIVIDFIRISQPTVIKVIHLQRESFEIIRYSWCATLLGITDGTKLFIITGNGNNTDRADGEKNNYYFLLPLLQINNIMGEILDFLIYEYDEESTRIFILEKNSKFWKCGSRIIVYSLKNDKYDKMCVIELTNMLNSLSYGRDKYEFIVVPYLTKQLHFFKIEKNYRGITLTEALISGHQLRNINVSVNDIFVITCGYDGLIIIRDKMNIHQVLAIFMSHHRLDGGTKFTYFSSPPLFSLDTLIISLGRNGDLIATKICNLQFISDYSLTANKNSSHKEPKPVDSITGKLSNLTWIEQEIATNEQKEEEECITERNLILQDFLNLRKLLGILLDENETESKNVQLAIASFDLDDRSRARKIDENIEKRRELMEKLNKEIYERDKVSIFVRKLCWDKMKIHACSLLSIIDGKTRVDNFPLVRVTKNYEDRRKWENFIVQSKASECSINERKNLIPDDLSIVATTTHRFIPEMTNSTMIDQVRKCPNYNEGVRASIIMSDREHKLKMYFNELFKKMQLVKEDELNMAAKRLEDMKNCSLELKNMFHTNPVENNKFSKSQALLLSWHFSEKPEETIVTVTESEISKGRAAKYFERDVVRLEMLEKEKEEGLKLKDTFREKALEIMMDGSLEVRWKDEIKKDPAGPSWLSMKDPLAYTEKEIAESQIYRTKCDELKRQREIYKKMLQDKMIQVEEELRQGVESFDRRLRNLHLDRMKIESAILQEKLMRLRESQRHSLRRQGMKIIQSAKDQLSLFIQESFDLNNLSIILESAVNETRNRYENLSKREKILDGKFRGEFADLKQPIVEHLSRHYRKRGRNLQLTSTSITYLTETGRCVLNGEESHILPNDCLTFLHGINNLDAIPNNLPLQIDNNHWNLLCKLRRAKLELEIKMKSCAVELAEAEQTLAIYHKYCTISEIKINQCKEMIKNIESENEKELRDMRVQLVIKMGQIESRLYGDKSEELSNAVLVPFVIVQDANNSIIMEGEKKLAAMRKNLIFRRKILSREWRHKSMRITLDNLTQELKVLQAVKVTREMRNYLPMMKSLKIGGEKNKKKKIIQTVVSMSKQRLRSIGSSISTLMLAEKRRKFKVVNRDVKFFRDENKKHDESMKNIKSAIFNGASMLINDENLERERRYHTMKLKASMKRTRLVKKVDDNYNELLAMQTQLELLRLKTYPTLRLKGLL